MAPLLGAIAGCHCSLLWREKGKVTANFLAEWTWCDAGCHCTALWRGEGRVTAKVGAVDVLPMQGVLQNQPMHRAEWTWCHEAFYKTMQNDGRLTNFAQTFREPQILTVPLNILQSIQYD